jgi:enterochelin esterase-like enzyme
MRALQRFEARGFRFWSAHAPVAVRWALPLFFAYEALGVLGSRADIRDGALDAGAQALSILSVGHITYDSAPKWVAALDGAMALSLLSFTASRSAALLTLARGVLALLALALLREDLFATFPLRPNSLGYGNVATLFLCGVACLTAVRARWQHLQGMTDTARVLEETAAQIAARRRAWKRFACVAAPLTLLVALVWPLAWPRYLKWFHARQEAAALDVKMSGQLLKKSMPPSAILGGRKITTWVYLPPGYGNGGLRYPVVYVMHGMPGEVRDCFVKGQIQDAAEHLIKARQIRPMILVGWDGQGPGGPNDVTNYLDRPDCKMESFMLRELVPYIDRTYRTIADARFRALDGISAGGFAALNLVLKHPDIWKTGASHTGFFSPEDDAGNMTAILGPRASNPAQWSANDPTKTVLMRGQHRGLHFYLDIGEGDDLLPEFNRFATLVKKQDIRSEVHIFPGRHTWDYWSQHYFDSLRFIEACFRKP